MKKFLPALLIFSICHLPCSICHATNWLVGPSHTYTKPSQVAGLVLNGDTVSIDPGTYTADVAHWTANNLLLRGVGNAKPHLNASNTAWGQKGIWVIGGNNTRVRNIEFSHCHDAAGVDMNWAGIRQEGLNLTVSNCYFHDNDNGILAGTLNPSKIVIEFTEFNHNGYGDGYSHNLYINHVDTLVFRYNYSHHATVGHELKSRANVNYILYNRFSNEATGDASREIDLPNGGPAILIGNVIEQGPQSQNSGIIGYGLEGLSSPAPHELYMVNNTIVNDKSSGTFVSMSSSTGFFKAYNNIFAGSGTLLNGFAALMDTAKNWRVTNIASVGFVNAAAYDYYLAPTGSQAIDAGTAPGTTNVWYNLTPSKIYRHTADSATRVPTGAGGQLDIGAYEYIPVVGISEYKNDLDFSFFVSHKTLNLHYREKQDAFLRIVDLNGKLLKKENVSGGRSEIDLLKFETGIYILEIISGGRRGSGVFFLQ